MAVENLAIIGGSLAGLPMNPTSGALGSVGTWMTTHGMSPTHVAIGAVAGAFLLQRESFVDGALKGAALVAVVEAAYHYFVR